jgi:hypothetical protein
VKLWHWLLGGGIVAGGLLAASTAEATPAKRVNATNDEDRLNLALRRLSAFIEAAKINAHAYRMDVDAGLVLGVQPGDRFVVEDSRAIPRQVDGLDVVIKGWPR